MKFKLLSANELEITAETPAEVREVIKHYGLDPFQYPEAFTSGVLTYVHSERGRDNAAIFAGSVELVSQWTAPYERRLRSLTGYTGPFGGIFGVPILAYGPNLCHTFLPTQAYILQGGSLLVSGFQWAADWNGRDAAERAGLLFADYVQQEVGARKSEPEYIAANEAGTLMRRNPNYLKRYAPHPEATNARFFNHIVQWWLDEKATPGQRELVAKALACHRTVCNNHSLGAWLLRSYENGWRTSWEGPLVTFEEFKAL